MNVTEMVEAMHEARVPSEPDLERVTRQGRRIAVRRRAGFALGAAAAVVVVAGTWSVSAGGTGHDLSPSTETSSPAPHDDVRELLGDRAHLRSLAGVTVAAAPEHAVQATACMGAGGLEDLGERVGRVRVVDDRHGV